MHSMSFNSKASLPPRELCSSCLRKPFDLICQCGLKFDFNCISKHIASINQDFDKTLEETKQCFAQCVQMTKSNDDEDSEQQITEWLERRTRDIFEIAEKYKNSLRNSNTATNTRFDDLQQEVDEISSPDDDRNAHEKLVSLLEIQKQIKERENNISQFNPTQIDLNQLDAELASRLTVGELRLRSSLESTPFNMSLPTIDRTQKDPETILVENELGAARASMVISSPSRHSFSEIHSGSQNEATPSSTSSTDNEWTHVLPTLEPAIRRTIGASENFMIEDLHKYSNEIEQKPIGNPMFHEKPRTVNELLEEPSISEPKTEPVQPIVILNRPPTEKVFERPEEFTGPQSRESLNTRKPEEPVPVLKEDDDDDSDGDGFTLGTTAQIESDAGIDIPVVDNDSSGILASHQSELFYVDKNSLTNETEIVVIPNVQDKDNVTRSSLGLFTNDTSEIVDVAYSPKHDTYLILTETSVRVFVKARNTFEDFYRATETTFKRIACNEFYVYVVAKSPKGDQIIRLDTNGRVSTEKFIREILPQRLSRHPSSSTTEIIDIATNGNDQLAITYRFDRRHELGICIYRIITPRDQWTCSKQLLLNECWQEAVKNTPRLDWSAKMGLFVLIEYVTGHLINFNSDGDVTGERRFFHNDENLSPINISISDDGWLCTRYENVINVKRIN